MIAREFTAERLNAIVNDPSVHPWVARPGQGYLDLSPFVADERNILLSTDGGAFLFTFHEQGIYEVHSQFLPEVRGKEAIAAMREAFYWMFTATPCMEILTQIPANNRAASMFARRVGATLEFTRPNSWPTADGLVSVKYYAMRYNDWVRSAEGLIEAGEAFHVKLKAGMKSAGFPDAEHPEDEAHDRYVGACYAMVAAGQIPKAITLYNRWARFTGHDLISMVESDILDIGHVFLRLECGIEILPPPSGAWDFEVLPCQ